MHVNDLAYCFPSLNTAVERTQSLNQHIINSHRELNHHQTSKTFTNHHLFFQYMFKTCCEKLCRFCSPQKSPHYFSLGGEGNYRGEASYQKWLNTFRDGRLRTPDHSSSRGEGCTADDLRELPPGLAT